MNSSFAQKWLWEEPGVNHSSNSSSAPNGIATDKAGNIYEAGGYSDTVSFGKDTLNIAGFNSNVYLIKYDASGNVLWARSSLVVNASSSGSANCVSVDNIGNVYIGGSLASSICFAIDTVKGGKGFLVKYDATGNVLWVKSFSDEINSIAADNSNNIYLSFANTANLIKCSPSGDTIWERKSSSLHGGYSSGNCLATDSLGNVYMTGLFNAALILGKDTTTSIGGYVTEYISKFDTGGNIKWIKTGNAPSSSPQSRGISVATDNLGNVYLTGMFSDTITFDSYTFMNGHKRNVFIVKYAPTGNVIWAEDASIAWGYGATGYSVCTDQWKNVYLSGEYEDTMSMGGATLVVGNSAWLGNSPSFIFKFDSTGHTLCSAGVNNENQTANEVVADPSGDNVYFGGNVFQPSIPCDFGSSSLTGSGYAYAFLAKLTCSGPLSVNDLMEKNKVMVFPNPSPGKFTVSIQSLTNKPQLTIYDLMGGIIYDNKLTRTNTQMDLSRNSNRIYLYRIISEKGELIGSGKLVIE